MYVNGNEFPELTNNTLNVRVQKADTSYEYFTLQAKDKAGNMSEIYKVGNPYYENPDAVKRIQRFPERSRMQLLCQPMELQVSPQCYGNRNGTSDNERDCYCTNRTRKHRK